MKTTAAGRLVVLLSALAAARADALEAVKFPTGPVSPGPTPGSYVARPGDVLRWTVVLDNSRGTTPVTLSYRDVVDPSGAATCDASLPTPCSGAEALRLLCPTQTWDENYPETAGGVLTTCDPATGTLVIGNVTVPVGGVRCLRFSTSVDLGTTARTVGNQGCVLLTAPTPGVQPTSPPQSFATACAVTPAAASGCTQVLVAGEPPSGVTSVKTATFGDADLDGRLGLGELVTWTLELRNFGPPTRAWVSDTLPAGLTVDQLLQNPDNACTATSTTVTCPVVQLPTAVLKTLRFTTRVDCAAVTEDDSFIACNQALTCLDTIPPTCFSSDGDLAPPATPTCLDMPFTDFSASTKTSQLIDLDGDGVASAGDHATYVVTVTNAGRLGSAGVRVVDDVSLPCMVRPPVDLGSGTYDAVRREVTWDLGPMAAGESRSVSFTVELAEPAGSTTCCNAAAVVSDEREACGAPAVQTDNPHSALANDRTCVDFAPQAAVSVTKSLVVTTDVDGDGVADDGDGVTFTVTITNDGLAAATEVLLDDPLAPCLAAFDPAAVTITGDGINDSDPPSPPGSGGLVRVVQVGGADGLAPGETVTVQFAVTVSDPGGAGCCNQARVTFVAGELAGTVVSDDPATAFPDDALCTLAQPRPGLLALTRSVTDADGDACLEPGEALTFTLEAAASGGDVRGARLSEFLDPAGAFTSVDASAGGGTWTALRGAIEWSLGDLAAGTSRTVQWTGVLSCAARGTLGATALLAAADSPTVTDAWSAPVAATQLTVTKTSAFADGNGNALLDAGEVVTFDVTVRNDSACVRPTVLVEDELDADLDLSGAVTTPVAQGDGRGLFWWDATTLPALGDMAAGASVSLRIRAAAVDPATNGDASADGLVDNVATALVASGHGCADAVFGDIAPTIDLVGDVRPPTLLRERRVSCRSAATVAAYLRERPAPQECSSPPAIDPSSPSRVLMVDAVPPVLVPGDGLTVGERCPADGTERGVLIFYELDRCTDTLRVTKSRAVAGALVVSW